MAHEAFDEIQTRDADARADGGEGEGLDVTDYRDVIRELKKEQLVGDAILPHYQARLKELEAIIAREKLVTLPTRPARIRLASAGRDRGAAGAEHAAAAPGRQHRRAGRVRAAAERALDRRQDAARPTTSPSRPRRGR